MNRRLPLITAGLRLTTAMVKMGGVRGSLYISHAISSLVHKDIWHLDLSSHRCHIHLPLRAGPRCAGGQRCRNTFTVIARVPADIEDENVT
ncbi:hypothetical protein IW261DRAFT_1487618 [Armillaria novae-zelandiae]|uniref:Uncharacterized protein n=1 Tax=Armillaria novae-zelandiae TaxID=153914 RepID=A0AA39UCN1_9AGAR|nr:hypothetical protein IW261DRAFT_1487618 [Armillaria novae-zelandiae]